MPWRGPSKRSRHREPRAVKQPRPRTAAVRHLATPSPEDEVARLTRELAAVRARLESAEFALTHLGPGDQPLEARLEAHGAESRGRRPEPCGRRPQAGRDPRRRSRAASGLCPPGRRIERQAGSRRSDEEGERDARGCQPSPARRRRDRCQVGPGRPGQISKRPRRGPTTCSARPSWPTPKPSASDPRSSSRSSPPAPRPQAFIRSSRLEAEARARELTDLAHQQLADAQRQAETDHPRMPNTKPDEDSRHPITHRPRSRSGATNLRPGKAQPRRPRGHVNRVDHGRKFGRPQQ